jgi:hypothetical protein
MWGLVGLVKTDVSKKRGASILRVEEITRALKIVRRLLTFLLQFEEHLMRGSCGNEA